MKYLLENSVSAKDTVLTSLNKLYTSNSICSVFAGLSGNTDQDLFPISGELAHIRDDVSESCFSYLHACIHILILCHFCHLAYHINLKDLV